MLPFRARVDLGAVPMKRYSAFPKAPALLEPYHQIVLCHIRTLVGGVLPLCRDAVGVFCNPSRLGHARARVIMKDMKMDDIVVVATAVAAESMKNTESELLFVDVWWCFKCDGINHLAKDCLNQGDGRRRGQGLRKTVHCYYCHFMEVQWCNSYHRRKWTRWHEFKS